MWHVLANGAPAEDTNGTSVFWCSEDLLLVWTSEDLGV